LIVFCQSNAFSQQNAGYSPDFEIYGIVKQVMGNSFEIYAPAIDKQIKVQVSSNTLILDKMDKIGKEHKFSEIKKEDLVVIKGILKKEIFLSREISFLSVNLDF